MKFSIQYLPEDGGVTKEVCQVTFDPALFTECHHAEEVITAMVAGLEATSTSGAYFFYGV